MTSIVKTKIPQERDKNMLFTGVTFVCDCFSCAT